MEAHPRWWYGDPPSDMSLCKATQRRYLNNNKNTLKTNILSYQTYFKIPVIILTWSSWATREETTEPEDDGPLILLHHLWNIIFYVLNFWNVCSSFCLANYLEADAEREWHGDHDESPREHRQQPAAQTNAVVALISCGIKKRKKN